REGLGFRRELHALTRTRVHLIAGARFDENCVLARTNQVASKSQRDPVELVGRGLAAPKSLRYDPEDGPAIPPIDARWNVGDFEITHNNRATGVRGHPARSALDQLAAALKQIRGVFHQLAA